eukprot:CAMPEP_0115335664 /NCGR_PEP_ID=MMETSP0270-20121206/88586_1 /TAXON_ID=71861 /ORGANISM="Scrippsiella trochoidea, Strain CCMP3099" /LENGTH=292 /DNA_ID=CAMNT_0002756771 /DNA_START=24 /DNA_END=898 /DNA_ORIENTATION=-
MWAEGAKGVERSFFTPSEHVFLESVVLICIVAATSITRRNLELEVEKEIEAQVFRSEKPAVNTLLQTVCDAVVELDGDLNIVGDIDRLEAFMILPLGSCGKCTTLQHFLLTEEDQNMFQDHLKLPPQGLAGALHMKMLDGAGHVLEVEIFHVKFVGPSGDFRYMVGMREFAESTSLTPLWCEGGDGELEHPVRGPAGVEQAAIVAVQTGACGNTPPVACRASLGPGFRGQIAKCSLQPSSHQHFPLSSVESNDASHVSSSRILPVTGWKSTSCWAKEFTLNETLASWLVAAP